MEEGERVGGGMEEGGEQEDAISGFASCLAASLLKEGMKEKEGESDVWAIPCSSDCHSRVPGPGDDNAPCSGILLCS